MAGTPVQMADGSTKPIEQVKQGDLVKSRDPQTGKPVAERVVQTFHRQSEALVSVTVKDAQTGQTETFQCSPDHPFYVPGEGWVAAGELAQGSSITSRAGPKLSVVSVSWQRQTPQQLSAGSQGYTVYNFEVEKTHTFFVGVADGGTWVHNEEPCDGIEVTDENMEHVMSRHGPDAEDPEATRFWPNQNIREMIEDALTNGNKKKLPLNPQGEAGDEYVLEYENPIGQHGSGYLRYAIRVITRNRGFRTAHPWSIDDEEEFE